MNLIKCFLVNINRNILLLQARRPLYAQTQENGAVLHLLVYVRFIYLSSNISLNLFDMNPFKNADSSVTRKLREKES